MDRLAAYESDEEMSPERQSSSTRQWKSKEPNSSQSSSCSPHRMSSEVHSSDTDQNKRERVNSDAWSDEDASYSSRKSPSSSYRMEPPPPKRPSPMDSDRSFNKYIVKKSKIRRTVVPDIHAIPSHSSLVSYGEHEDEDDDQFENNDQVDLEDYGVEEQSLLNSVSSEKNSRSIPLDHRDERSPNEIAIDAVIEEGLRNLNSNKDNDDQIQTLSDCQDGTESPFSEMVAVKLPPVPEGKCSKELEENFKDLFCRKAKGIDLNEAIKRRRDFKNPSIYEKLIEKFDVDELGSNFDKSVFDPHGFPSDCYYDRIAVMQKELMEKHALVEKKVLASAAAAVATSRSAEAKRKSRFENAKK